MRAIVVHGVEIPEILLAQEAQNHPGLSVAEARKAAGDALATKALLLHRALELGLTAEPELDEDGREESDEAALVRAVLDAEVEIVPPTEAECRRVYEAQKAKFRQPALYEAAHILIEPNGEGEAADAAARLAAARLIKALDDEVWSFAEAAKAHSACPSGALGGSLGQLRPGDLVAEVEDALAQLQPGQVGAEPVRSRFGWHVLKLDRRIEGRDPPFEAVEGRIRLHLEGRAWAVAASRYVLGLAEAARAKGIAIALGQQGDLAEGSACLGDFLGDGVAAERLIPWLEAADPALLARLGEAAQADSIGLAACIRSAAADFVRSADDERWTQLISAAQGTEDPALAALAAILRSRLAPPQRTFTVIGRRGASAARSAPPAAPGP